MRAVGQALRNNPYPITFPCHRVIKSDGDLGGYAGKFDNNKKRLLDFEKQMMESLKAKNPANLR
jgi:methylated-DNA-[protein]-cysteine S-methyltransferase